jgi:hypothetical protein
MEVFKEVKFSNTFNFSQEHSYYSSDFECDEIKLKVVLSRYSNIRYHLTLDNIGSELLKVSSFSCDFSEGLDGIKKKVDFVLEQKKQVFLEVHSNLENGSCKYTVTVERSSYGKFLLPEVVMPVKLILTESALRVIHYTSYHFGNPARFFTAAKE